MGEGEGGVFWESSVETGILSRVGRIPGPGWMQGMRAQGWWTGKTRRDGMGGGCGRGLGDGEHMWIHGWFMSMYGKNHCNIVR